MSMQITVEVKKINDCDSVSLGGIVVVVVKRVCI